MSLSQLTCSCYGTRQWFHRVLFPTMHQSPRSKPGRGRHCAETRRNCLPMGWSNLSQRPLGWTLNPPTMFSLSRRLQRCGARTDGLGDNGAPTRDGQGTSGANRWAVVRFARHIWGEIHWNVEQRLNSKNSCWRISDSNEKVLYISQSFRGHCHPQGQSGTFHQSICNISIWFHDVLG